MPPGSEGEADAARHQLRAPSRFLRGSLVFTSLKALLKFPNLHFVLVYVPPPQFNGKLFEAFAKATPKVCLAGLGVPSHSAQRAHSHPGHPKSSDEKMPSIQFETVYPR